MTISKAMKRLAIPLLLVCGAVVQAQSAELNVDLEYEARLGMTYSDNLERRPSGFEEGTSAAVVGMEVKGAKDTGRLRYNVLADMAWYNYLSSNVDPEVLGRANLAGAYYFVPDVFAWNLGLGYDQARDDILRPLAPGNIDSQTTLTTGPTVRMRFGNTMGGQLDGRYSRLNNSSGESDSETLGGQALLSRRANPRSLVALGVGLDDVSYLGNTGSSAFDFQRQEAFLRLNYSAVRTTIESEVGFSDVSGENISDSGPLIRARLTRRVGPTLSAFVGYIHEYPTSYPSSLNLGGTDGGIGGDGQLGSAAIATAPRVASIGEIGLTLDRTRVDASVAYLHRKEESLVLGLGERNYDEYRARVTRHFTPKARGNLHYSQSNEEFTAFAEDFDERLIGAGLEIDFGRALGLTLSIENRQRKGNLSRDEFRETSGGLYFRYSGEFGRSSAASSSTPD